MVSSALSAVGISGSADGSGFGAAQMALKVLIATASKYVESKTKVSLKQWSDFVSTAQTQFEAYLAQLGKVASLAVLHEAAAPAAGPDTQQLRKDKELIEDTQLKTRLWRPILTRLPQLSEVIDSILQSKKDAAPKAEPAQEKSGWAKLKGGFDDLKGQIIDEQDELLKPLLAPVYEVRERITELRTQVDKMSEAMFELEDLLDLERAQIQVMLGEIPAREAEILGQRIAVAILIPRLQKRLAEARQSAATYQGFLERLQAGRKQAGLSERVYSTLAAEYQAGLDTAARAVHALEEELAAWRARAPRILEANQNWLQEERQAVEARKMVGQLPGDEAGERLAGIRRELKRTEEASRQLAT